MDTKQVLNHGTVDVKLRHPSRGLLRDYEPSCGPSFQALGRTLLHTSYNSNWTARDEEESVFGISKT